MQLDVSNRKTKTGTVFLYFFLSILIMEYILRYATVEALFSKDILSVLFFSISFSAFFFFLITLFQGKKYYVGGIVLLISVGIIFSSQLIYFKFFRTFYTLYSAGNGGQVFQFWKDIATIAFKNSPFILLLLIPGILFAVLGKRCFSFEITNWKTSTFAALIFIVSHAMALGIVFFGDKAQNSAFDLYFKSNNPVISVDKLGLLTTMRLDFERLITGWSPEGPVSEEPTITTTAAQSEPAENKKIEYNVVNIDFKSLISGEADETIKNMDEYFSAVAPTSKNEFTGKYKGYNLILITAESFSPMAVRKDLTPTLYKMVTEGYNFTNFYNPLWGVITSNGEYVATTSLIPKSGVWSYVKSGSNYMPFAMGNQLKALGYKTSAYHDHTYNYYKRNISHPNMGYVYKGVGNGLNIKKTWPESDIEMMQKTAPEYINDQPFHTYYMTVSGHLNYNFTGNAMAAKNKQLVKNLPYSDAAKAYISCQIEFDRAMEYLLKSLEEKGILNKTLIAISPDHYPYGLTNNEISELRGHSVETNFELYKSTFILYTGGMKPTTVDKPMSSLDIIPTISNLLGIEYDSRLLMGRDVFSDCEPLVMFLNKSFITEKGKYNALTKEFIPNSGVKVNQDYINKISAEVDNKFYYSAKILDTNYYKKVLGK